VCLTSLMSIFSYSMVAYELSLGNSPLLARMPVKCPALVDGKFGMMTIRWIVPFEFQQVAHLTLFSLMGLIVTPVTRGWIRSFVVLALAAAHFVVAGNVKTQQPTYTHSFHIEYNIKLDNGFVILECLFSVGYLLSVLVFLVDCKESKLQNTDRLKKEVEDALYNFEAAVMANERKASEAHDAVRSSKEKLEAFEKDSKEKLEALGKDSKEKLEALEKEIAKVRDTVSPRKENLEDLNEGNSRPEAEES